MKILMREPPQQFDVDVDLFLAAKLSLYYWVTTAHIILYDESKIFVNVGCVMC